MTLLSQWSAILGSLTTKVRLEKIQDDTLTLGVYDACWMQELYLLSPLLITTINQNLDQPRIKHLRFKRSVAKKDANTLGITARTEPPNVPLELTASTKKALAIIKDPQLSLALHNFLIRCHKEKV